MKKKLAKAHRRYIAGLGEYVPGVTTIVGQLAKPALISWANKMGLKGIDTTKYVDLTAQAGTLAHAMIISHLKGEACDTGEYGKTIIDLAENSLLSYLNWEKSHKIRLDSAEVPLVSDTYRYGGTIDFLGWIDDIYTLVDFKTGGDIYEEAFIQCGGYYALSGMEIHHWPIKRVMIINIPRTEDEIFKVAEVPASLMEIKYWPMFRCLLDFYHLRNKGKDRWVPKKSQTTKRRSSSSKGSGKKEQTCESADGQQQ